MTLQMKFFRLVSIDSSGQSSISSPSDVAVEVDAYTYQSGKIGPSPDMFVSAQEVVFDSLGKVTCNRSMYVISMLSRVVLSFYLLALILIQLVLLLLLLAGLTPPSPSAAQVPKQRNLLRRIKKTSGI